jgi:hypothetical protein
MASVWHHYGISMGKVWERYGKSEASVGLSHGNVGLPHCDSPTAICLLPIAEHPRRRVRVARDGRGREGIPAEGCEEITVPRAVETQNFASLRCPEPCPHIKKTYFCRMKKTPL